MLDDSSIYRIVKPILHRALPAVETMTVESVVDHMDEPAIRVTVKHKEGAPPFIARTFLDAVNEAMDALRHKGETRYLYVRNLYSDGEPALDDMPKTPRRKKRA